jgi:hypothetical protein
MPLIQPQTQTRDYWLAKFAITDSDIEPIYNHFLEVERPLPIEAITKIVMAHRVAAEKQELNRRLSGRKVYQPQQSYAVGDGIVFPALKFSYGQVVESRSGFNPQDGQFKVIGVEISGKVREFAAELSGEHKLNLDNGTAVEQLIDVDLEELFAQYSSQVAPKVAAGLEQRPEFIRLAQEWFIKGLMAEINIGHLHLAEAVLEVSNGGPLPPEEILVHLDLSDNINTDVQRFSLNYALLQDNRFDEVAPKGKVAWFLQRMEPEGVRQTPERLVYEPVSYDRHLLTTEMLMLEQELDDEWSVDLKPPAKAEPTILSLTYPHRWAGTLPLSSRIVPLVPPSRSPRQQIHLVDDETGEEMIGWIVQYQRYIHGLADWYARHQIPVGGFITLKPGPEPGVLLIGYDRRRNQKEWVRLATVVDNRIRFELERRSISCGYDDLLIVGTDYVAAIDALWRRATEHKRSLTSLLIEVVPELINLGTQNSVHAKTIYSALNMLRRVPPGPVFAELVRHPAFKPLGDYYWQFDAAAGRSS